ncbi:MAG: nitrite/sulfite reductase [Nitrospinota bacterium]|nr:nitrite/sulfite reductase [Nitrospinota bacterium]
MCASHSKSSANVSLPVIPILEEEFDDFETEVTKFHDGELAENEFTGWRLLRGVYGQRQADSQMFRIKIPFGGMTADQLETLGVVARDYTPLKKGHVTTRENFQFHFIRLEDAADLMRLIAKVGLTTREACGNTVRNVTGCAFAGVCKDQVFDSTPYAGAFARYFARKDFIQNLPRKFKAAFSSCSSDCVVAGIHDIGFIPVIKEIEGVVTKGFKMLVGGGLATFPRVAETLYEFIPATEFLRVSEAIVRVFNKSKELRKSRFKARIKFLVGWIGIDGLRERVEKELTGKWATNPINIDEYLWEDNEYEDLDTDEEFLSTADEVELNGDHDEYTAWESTNVREQLQSGFYAAEIKLPLGDITADQFFALAEISRKYAGSRARTSYQQNIVLRWIKKNDLKRVWVELKKIGLSSNGAQEITDIVSCPGTDSCKLGITSSMGLATAIRNTLEEEAIEDTLTKELQIKMSGCPNSCGQHHIANIGFHGGTLRSGGKMLPAYELFIGGQHQNTNGLTKLGERLRIRIPAKRVPNAVKRILTFYKENRNENEKFNDFFERMGNQSFEKLLQEFHINGQFNEEEKEEIFVDWGKKESYVLERGEGECMA